MSRSAVESFFRTLLLGDFEEHQSTSGQVVAGLIGMIPVLGQVMDARDVTGALFNINQRGGFKNASVDQLVNLGFAAFGSIPYVGDVFKLVFKPLYKQRRLAKGAVQGGLHKLEAMLGLGKGGALTWIRKELIGKWAARTNQIIAKVNMALNTAIELTEFLATASGWKDWLVPDPIQAMAKQMLPGMKAMRGQIDAPLRRASNEIREFLEDLLGEQAAAVVMAVGQRATPASAVPGTRTRKGHNAAAIAPKGPVPKRQTQRKVAATPATQASKGQGPLHRTIQATRKAISAMATQEKGLVGEHMVDYHELKRLGGNWPHDNKTGKWSPNTVKKLNCDKRPVNLSLEDLPKVNQPGLDAVWERNGAYTVTEAKASASVGAAYAFGKHKEKKGWIPVVSGLSQQNQLLHYLLSDTSDKRGTQTPMLQMSYAWTKDRAKREGLTLKVQDAIELKKSSRRVVLVSLESPGASDHVEALADIHLGHTRAKMHPHPQHDSTSQWEASDIDAVERARIAAHKANAKKRKPDEPGASVPKAKRPRP
jgi:hypothetical protein